MTGGEEASRLLRGWLRRLSGMTTATLLAINIPLMLLFFGVWSGIPLWMVIKHPDREPEGQQALPAYLRVPATRPASAPARPASGRSASGRAVPAAHGWHVDRLRVTAK
jgi:hypothetical protein